MPEVLFAPTKPEFTPVKAYETDAGFNVYAAQSRMILHGEIIKIPLGFKMALPTGYEAQLRPRSSMGGKGIVIPNSPGTIDAGYRGEVCVLLQNTYMDKFQVTMGDAVAQLVIKKVPDITPVVVDARDLPPAQRGVKGFGSTGRTGRV